MSSPAAKSINLKYDNRTYNHVLNDDTISVSDLVSLAKYYVESLKSCALEISTNTGQILDNGDVTVEDGDTFLVKSLCKPFSSYYNNWDLVKSHVEINEASNHELEFGDVEVDDEAFQHCLADLRFKERNYDISGGSEATWRVFINSVLLAACESVPEVKLRCEEMLKGSIAAGHVDWCLIFRDFKICITEAKKQDLDGGLAQTAAQLLSVLDENSRKRPRDDTRIKALPALGITTTYRQWSFLRTLPCTRANAKPVVDISKIYNIPSLCSEHDFDDSVAVIVKTIIGMLRDQKRKICSFDEEDCGGPPKRIRHRKEKDTKTIICEEKAQAGQI